MEHMPRITFLPPGNARGSKPDMPRSKARGAMNNYGRLYRTQRPDNARPGDVFTLMDRVRQEQKNAETSCA